MKYKAIIFDMDGTIITTETIWQQASRHILKKHAQLSDDECNVLIAQFKGGSLYTTCTYIQKTFNTQATVEEIIQEKQAFALERFKDEIAFIEGFTDFHDRITQKSLPIAIATNSNQHSLDVVLKHLPLETMFAQHIYSIDRVNKAAKPKPDIYLFAAEKLGIHPSECIAVEDSTHGISAAKAAGMFCIGINSGHDRSALQQADIIIDHYDEINLDNLLE